jgi:hypothetical protein
VRGTVDGRVEDPLSSKHTPSRFRTRRDDGP